MTRARIRMLEGLALLVGLIYSAACGTTVAGRDCKAKCQDVDRTCVGSAGSFSQP